MSQNNQSKTKIVDFLILIFLIAAVSSLISYDLGYDKGRKEITYTCPYIPNHETLSSTIILDEKENPVAMTCSYFPSQAAYGKLVIRKNGKIIKMKERYDE